MITVVVRPGLDEDRMAAVRQGVERLRERDEEVRPRLAFERGDGERFAREAAANGADVVVAVGGDGTINEVVNGIASSERGPALAVAPGGTANDFALGIGMPDDVGESLARIAERLDAPRRRIDLARLNDRWFVNVSTGGFGAEATEEAPEETKKLLGSWAYVVTGVKQFAALEAMAGAFESAGETLYEGDFLLFAVGNARRTGGGTLLTPRAELDDGALDLLVVPAMARVDFLTLLPDLRSGSHLDSPDILYARVRELTVTSERELSVNADGEPTKGRRFEYGVEPGAIELIEP